MIIMNFQKAGFKKSQREDRRQKTEDRTEKTGCSIPDAGFFRLR
jgi:hypothetical protein